MKFVSDIDKESYDQFVENHEKAHFLQSYNWGEFARLEKNLIPHYVGLTDDNNNLLATALLLQKKLPFGYSYFYSPRGYVVDYSNYELLKKLSDEIIDYCYRRKGIFVKLDPDLIINEYDVNNNEIIKENKTYYDTLTTLGYKHLGFTKNFETTQPRYSFRIHFDKPLEEIENNYSKTTKQRIKKAEDLMTEVRLGTQEDIKTFYNLMVQTETRKDFISHNQKYYETLYKLMHKEDKCELFLGSINLDKIINKFETDLSNLTNELEPLNKDELSKSEKSKKQELEKRINKIKEDLNKYKEARNKGFNEIVLNGHFIVEYGNMAWVLYAGNHNMFTETYANYKTYDNHIKHYYNKGIKIYDQFGTIGDLRKENPLLGLHEFKKKFGGNYVEFTGEFDYVLNKPMYFIFTKLVPLYRKIVKNIAKLIRGE